MAKFSGKNFWQTQRAKPPAVEKGDLRGKTVIVVGANGGLGFEASKHFARFNPGRLILACRNQSKGQAALERIQEETGCKTGEVWIVDLTEFASVQRFADKFAQDGGRLDILVANAAVILNKYEETKDGWETCLQGWRTPHCPRIVVVASDVHYWATIEKAVLKTPNVLKTLGSKEFCTPKHMVDQRYFLTKLLNVMFVRALNERIAASTPLVVNAVNPGFCFSNIRQGFTGFQLEAGSWCMPLQGENSDPNKLRGEYITLWYKVDEVSNYLLDAEGAQLQNRIWKELIEILTKADPRIASTVGTYLTEK
ncbi:hypothetical protein MVEN_00407900 [Mycena venus]|uniref:NAD(P)-binding protein n=1 Tax=Mycena venus TaxID=2733690 RepID=A0A8H6YVC3_9AGAR|nr:hypothetical protein MVEN_00407900 [Mycena venus]